MNGTVLGSTFFAEIVGLDCSRPLDDATFATIRQAWFDHAMLLFRGQALSDDDLLAFSRRQMVHPEVVHVGTLLEAQQKMLHRVIGEDIALAVIASRDQARVRVDAGQLDAAAGSLSDCVRVDGSAGPCGGGGSGGWG